MKVRENYLMKKLNPELEKWIKCEQVFYHVSVVVMNPL
jgi:hypothetical protein